MDDLQKTAEECEDIYDKTCSISYPDDGANLPETSEIILAPNNVKISPSKISEVTANYVKSRDIPGHAFRLNGKVSILRKQFSEPVIVGEGSYRKHRNATTTIFDNPAYEDDEVIPTNQSFADVVSQLINEPIPEDTHPYGRGHLYATALKLDLPTIHRDEGSLFLWFLATAVILGLVGAVILMSVMYEPQPSTSTAGATTQSANVNVT